MRQRRVPTTDVNPRHGDGDGLDVLGSDISRGPACMTVEIGAGVHATVPIRRGRE